MKFIQSKVGSHGGALNDRILEIKLPQSTLWKMDYRQAGRIIPRKRIQIEKRRKPRKRSVVEKEKSTRKPNHVTIVILNFDRSGDSCVLFFIFFFSVLQVY